MIYQPPRFLNEFNYNNCLRTILEMSLFPPLSPFYFVWGGVLYDSRGHGKEGGGEEII